MRLLGVLALVLIIARCRWLFTLLFFENFVLGIFISGLPWRLTAVDTVNWYVLTLEIVVDHLYLLKARPEVLVLHVTREDDELEVAAQVT